MHPKKLLFLGIAVFAFSTLCTATEADKYQSMEFKPLIASKDLTAWEIGPELAKILASSDRIEVKHLQLKGSKEVSTSIVDKAAIGRLLFLLGMSLFQKKEACWCIAYPSYSFYKGDKLLISLSFPHGKKVRVSGGSLSGDYDIGEAAIQKATAILNSKT